MLEGKKFFDSLHGKLTGILLGTLTFGAVVPTLLDYLSAILYYEQDKNPAWDFRLVSGLYFLLPALSLAVAWPFVMALDGPTYIPPTGKEAQPPAWERRVRWLPAALLLGLTLVFGSLFYDLSHLPGRWLEVLCLVLLLAHPLLALLLRQRVNGWVQSVQPAAPAKLLITWSYWFNIVAVPLVATTLSVLLLLTTFADAGQQLQKNALSYAGLPSLSDTITYHAKSAKTRVSLPVRDSLGEADNNLWQTQYREQAIADSRQAPFQARTNYKEAQRLSKEQDGQIRHLSLIATLTPQPKGISTPKGRVQSDSFKSDSLSKLLLSDLLRLDDVRQSNQPRSVARCLAYVGTHTSQLDTLAYALQSSRLATHRTLAQALVQESAYLERDAQNYYSLLLGLLQFKGRLWLLVLLNLLLWGWAALRVADEGYYRGWLARQSPSLEVTGPSAGNGAAVLAQLSPPPAGEAPLMPFAQEQTLLQQFACIAFGLLVPLLNPVKPESIAIDKPLWSLSLPSFARTIVQAPGTVEGSAGRAEQNGGSGLPAVSKNPGALPDPAGPADAKGKSGQPDSAGATSIYRIYHNWPSGVVPATAADLEALEKRLNTKYEQVPGGLQAVNKQIKNLAEEMQDSPPKAK